MFSMNLGSSVFGIFAPFSNCFFGIFVRICSCHRLLGISFYWFNAWMKNTNRSRHTNISRLKCLFPTIIAIQWYQAFLQLQQASNSSASKKRNYIHNRRIRKKKKTCRELSISCVCVCLGLCIVFSAQIISKFVPNQERLRENQRRNCEHG